MKGQGQIKGDILLSGSSLLLRILFCSLCFIDTLCHNDVPSGSGNINRL